MKRKWIVPVLPLLLLLAASPAFSQYSAVNGDCSKGDIFPSFSGIPLSTPTLGSYPQCTVTVYYTGLGTKPTIYSSPTGAALTNPFTANLDGSWLFFAAPAQGYDVVLSAGAPFTMPSPRTWTDVFAGAGGGNGTVTSSGYSSGAPLAAFSSSTNIVPATYSNIVGAFGSGSCSGYLYSNGTCSTPGGTLPTGPLGQPLVNNNGLTGYGTSPMWWDCSKMPGATVDVQVNWCNSYALTTTVTAMDAQALNGTQTIASQINVGEFLPPVVSACIVGVGSCTATPGAGTYRVSITFGSAAVPESEASEEASITINGSQGIQIAPPVYYGAATTYNAYAGTGNPWTEKKCSSATGVAVGVTGYITAACAGATVSAYNTGAKLLLPFTGLWNCTITNAANWCLKWFDHTEIFGFNYGFISSFGIAAYSSSTNVAFLCGADLNTKGVAMYDRVEGFSCKNNVSATVNGGSDTGAVKGASNPIPGALFMQSSTWDSSVIQDIEAYQNSNGTVAGQISFLAYGTCCSTRVMNIHADGGGGGTNSGGGTPCQVGVAGGPTQNATAYIDLDCVHPGKTYHNINYVASGNGMNFYNVYLETNLGTGCDTTTPLIDIGTGAGIGGPIAWDSILVGAMCPGSTAFVVQVEAVVAPPYRLTNIHGGNTQFAVNDLVYNATSPGNAVEFWPPFNGLPVAVANLPVCNSTLGYVAQTGALWTANNCNAACVAGNTCTFGGAHYCQMVCTHSGTWVMTGVTE
jgi:hypothetical protein